MKGDALASGAPSATFSGGRAAVNDPIKFNWTVAQESREVAEIGGGIEAEAATEDSARHEAIIANLRPFNDRVLLRRLAEDNSKQVQIADSYKPKPNRGTVLAVGDGMVVGNEFRPIPISVGDVVVFGEYSAESIDIDGEELVIVSAFDIRLKLR